MGILMVFFWVFGFGGIGSAGEEVADLRKRLEMFGPPDGVAAKELERLVSGLESASFAERAAALKGLVGRPLLPESVLGLAETHPDLEVRYQLKKLRDDPERSARAAEMLEVVLGEVARGGGAGLADAVLGALPAAGQADLLPLAGRALLATAEVGDREKLLAAMGGDALADEVRRAVVPALAKVGGEGVEEALVGALRTEDTRLKAAAALELARLGRRESLEAFGDLLESDDLMVRWHAVAALRDVTGQHFGFGPWGRCGEAGGGGGEVAGMDREGGARVWSWGSWVNSLPGSIFWPKGWLGGRVTTRAEGKGSLERWVGNLTGAF